jgi:type IV pilus assembly protein PilB
VEHGGERVRETARPHPDHPAGNSDPAAPRPPYEQEWTDQAPHEPVERSREQPPGPPPFEPTPLKQVPEPPREPVPFEPASAEPAPVEPAPVEPATVEPEPVQPALVEPEPVEPVEPDAIDPADANGRPSQAPPDDGVAEQRPADSGVLGLTPPSRRGGSGRFITDHIVELGYATRERVDMAIQKARTTGMPPERVLLEAEEIDANQLARATAERFGLDHLDLSQFEVDIGAVNLVPPQAAKRFEAVPVAFIGDNAVLVAMTDPTNVRAVDDIAIMTGRDVRPAVASGEDVAAVMARMSKLGSAVADAIEEGEEEAGEARTAEVSDIRESADNAPVVKLVNGVIAQAVEERASDVHFEPQGREIRVRFRVDGMLHDATTIPRNMVAGVVSRLKIMGGLDISERRLPQDGRISLMVERHPVDVRVASLPAVHGEKMVLRLLDKEKALITLDKLGMRDGTLRSFSTSFRRSHGATLVTGPTGSGKTTSLYAALNVINTPEKNIITIEDPVEYQLPGMTQVQVNVRSGLTFAQGLRAIVRSDPDVIMVGEIRDRETAQIAIESALTGHLVLSTMHTNDAPSAMTRLTEMEIEPFLTASAVDCVVSQRLTRMLCASCKQRVVIPAEQIQRSLPEVASDLEAYEARGCARCANSGYKGRMGLYEAMLVTDEIRSLVIGRASADEIRAVAISQGMESIQQDGLDKIRSGITTIEEVARVTGSALSAE